MKFIKYVFDNILGIIIYMATVILMVMMVAVFKVPDEVGIIMLCSFFISGLSILIINFNKKNRFYKPFLSSLEKLDRKFLITETLKEEPITYEENSSRIFA